MSHADDTRPMAGDAHVKRIVWFHPRPWIPPQRGSDLRTHGLITTAISFGHHVTLVCPAGADTFPPPAGATHLAVEGYTRYPMWAASRIVSRHPLRAPRAGIRATRHTRSAVARLDPELVIVSESMSWALADSIIPPDVPVLYDAHNVEFRLYRDLSARALSPMDRLTLTVDARRVARDEARLMRRATTAMAVSEDDARALRAEYLGARVEVVPSSIATPPTGASPADAGPELLYVGALDYQPNAEAVAELVTAILPAVRRSVPEATLTVVGRGASAVTRELVASSPGATLLDDVHDLDPYYRRARCVAIPLRSGGGTKLKAFEAMAYGVPMVCTAETVRGIDVGPGEAVVAESTDEIVQGVLAFMHDRGAAARVGASARRGFQARLSWDAAVSRPFALALSGALDRASY